MPGRSLALLTRRVLLATFATSRKDQGNARIDNYIILVPFLGVK